MSWQCSSCGYPHNPDNLEKCYKCGTAKSGIDAQIEDKPDQPEEDNTEAEKQDSPPAPVQQKTDNTGCCCAFLVLIVLFSIFVVRGCESLCESTPEDKEEDVEHHAYIASQNYVEKFLKCPSTAKYPLWLDASITRSGSRFYISSYVDSQNSFGAMVRSQYYAEMEKSGSGEWNFDCNKLTIDGINCIGGDASGSDSQ
ncbi:MAG: hypothetical protein ABFD83_11910 [Armatimonadota bacterium]